MSVTSVGSNQVQSLGARLLQELNATGTGAQASTDLSSALEDLLTLSPTAQQLTKAPEAVVQAMSDLLTGQKDVSSDLSQIKSYFAQNPQGLAGVLSSLQGPMGTSGTSSALGSNGALLTALMNQASAKSDPAALLSLFSGAQRQDNLFAFLDGSSESDGGTLSIFG